MPKRNVKARKGASSKGGNKKTKNTSKGQNGPGKNPAPLNDTNEESDERREPRSLAVAQRGVQTGSDFAQMMSALMSDVIEGNITPQAANATVNAGGKLLKVVEMQLKYGKRETEVSKPFRLTG